MKKQLSLLVLLIATIYFLSSCQKEIVIGSESNQAPEAAQRSTTSIPFKGSFTTTAQLLQPPPIRMERVTGTGEATHLGESTFVATVTVNLTTPPPFQVTGTTVFTAANGDEFYTQFSGTSTPHGDGTATGVLHHAITGGTGRFAEISGNFTGIVQVNPANPTNSVTYEGDIRY
jgi:hypothetical protein